MNLSCVFRKNIIMSCIDNNTGNITDVLVGTTTSVIKRSNAKKLLTRQVVYVKKVIKNPSTILNKENRRQRKVFSKFPNKGEHNSRQ